jgi:hypothetical protein
MDQEWLDLREIVLAAGGPEGASPLIAKYPDHPIVNAVLAYLADRSQEKLINDAALTLARQIKDADPATVERTPWLVLDHI